MTSTPSSYTQPRPVLPSGKGPGWYLIASPQHAAVIIQKARRRGDIREKNAHGPFKTRKQAMTAAERIAGMHANRQSAVLLGALRRLTNTVMDRDSWVFRLFAGDRVTNAIEHAEITLAEYDRA